MAYAIAQSPQQFQPAYNDVIFVVTDPHYVNTNYKYIATITIGSETIKVKCYPDLTYGSGVFNIGRILETYLTSDIDKSTYSFQANTKSFKAYSVSFGHEEEFAGVITETTGEATTGTLYVWNGLVNYLPFQNYNQLSFNSSGGICLNYFNSLFTRKIKLEQDTWLYFNQTSVSNFNAARVKVYNSAGTLIRDCSVANSKNDNSNDNHHFVRFGCGTNNLNLITLLVTDYVGSGNIIASTATRYEIYFTGLATSSTYKWSIETTECRYTNYRLHWLNKLGAFESFNFIKKSTTETEISRTKYKPPVGGLTSERAYGYSVSDRGTKSFFTGMKDTLKLKSDWLNDYENILLQSLVESPEIYIDTLDVDGVGYELVPVTCIDSQFTTRTNLNDKMFNLDLTLQFCFDRYSQRQ